MKRLLLASLLLTVAGFASYDYPSYDYNYDYPNPPEEEQIVDYSSCDDLEDMQQPFVLGLHKLEIEGHPHAFNPSIVRWNGEILLSFRTYLEDHSTSEIGLVRLDEELKPIGEPSFLQFPGCDPGCILKRQDPRLIESNGRLLVVYNNVLDRDDLEKKVEIRRMFVAEVECDENGFFACEPECFFFFDGMNPQRSEKNWVPFDYNGKLLLSHSLFPHRILEPLTGTNSCCTLHSQYTPLEWKWGHLRGGTPALEVDGQYLAFFHSSTNLVSRHSKGKPMLHYFMGAYTFSKEEPFAIEKMSPEPISARGFYEGEEYSTWRPLRVVFPGGFLADDDHIWVAYGRQDHEVWIIKLDKQGLLNSLKEI